MPKPRSTLFIDGANWHYGLKSIGVDSGRLDYSRMARKLLIDRELTEIRYYVGRVSGDLQRVRRQIRFLKHLEEQGLHVFRGRVEKNWMAPERNPVIQELREVIADSQAALPSDFVEKLNALCLRRTPYYVEKQVDVRIAVDLVGMAHRNEYDVAYLLSADGDFVPAVEEAKRFGKRVFAVSAQQGRQLAKAVDAFIPLPLEWFLDLRE